ncbi:hypothetical protein EV126DRAFT_34365 [Verticillium dahliae]|nr:hypothetical protein EV126DRAFT_34365 [Verticillium dahliae]
MVERAGDRQHIIRQRLALVAMHCIVALPLRPHRPRYLMPDHSSVRPRSLFVHELVRRLWQQQVEGQQTWQRRKQPYTRPAGWQGEEPSLTTTPGQTDGVLSKTRSPLRRSRLASLPSVAGSIAFVTRHSPLTMFPSSPSAQSSSIMISSLLRCSRKDFLSATQMHPSTAIWTCTYMTQPIFEETSWSSGLPISLSKISLVSRGLLHKIR